MLLVCAMLKDNMTVGGKEFFRPMLKERQTVQTVQFFDNSYVIEEDCGIHKLPLLRSSITEMS